MYSSNLGYTLEYPVYYFLIALAIKRLVEPRSFRNVSGDTLGAAAQIHGKSYARRSILREEKRD